MNPKRDAEIQRFQPVDQRFRRGKFLRVELINAVVRRPVVVDAKLRVRKTVSNDFVRVAENLFRVDLLFKLRPRRPDRLGDHSRIGHFREVCPSTVRP